MRAEDGNTRTEARPGSWGTAVGSRARVLFFAGALVVLVVVAVVVGRIGRWTGRPMQTGTAELPTMPTRTQPSITRTPPQVDRTVPDTENQVAAWVWLLVAVVVAIIVYLLLRRAWDARRRIGERRRLQPEPDAATGTGIDDEAPPLVLQPAPGRQFDARAAADAIVSCWVWVEDWAAARGRPRLSFETPTEFLDRVIGRPSTGTATEAVTAQGDQAAATERMAAAQVLLPLYQRARFDVEALDPESAVRARDAALTVCGREPVDAP